MQSSTSSPFKLRVVRTRPGITGCTVGELFARFRLCDVHVERRVTKAGVVTQMRALVEAFTAPTLQLPPGTHQARTLLIGDMFAEVEINIEAMLAPNPPTLCDAVMFAIKELDPMLHTLTTLRAIELGIDIHVEHGLRYTDRALKAMTKNLSGRPFGFLLRDR